MSHPQVWMSEGYSHYGQRRSLCAALVRPALPAEGCSVVELTRNLADLVLLLSELPTEPAVADLGLDSVFGILHLLPEAAEMQRHVPLVAARVEELGFLGDARD